MDSRDKKSGENGHSTPGNKTGTASKATKNTPTSKSTSTKKVASKSASNGKVNSPQGADAEGLRKLLVDQMKDMLWAEKALTKAIPKMIDNASSEELIESLTNHLEETKQQVARLEEAFNALDLKPSTKPCAAMQGLMKEAEELMEEMKEGSLRDAAIICAAQKVEHYEIATYGCLVAYAEILGESEVSSLLEETLAEEKGADETLSQVAQEINWMAEEEVSE